MPRLQDFALFMEARSWREKRRDFQRYKGHTVVLTVTTFIHGQSIRFQNRQCCIFYKHSFCPSEKVFCRILRASLIIKIFTFEDCYSVNTA